MRIFGRNARRQDDEEAAPLDAVAVTLAIWLGLIVAVTGLVRLSANAALPRQSDLTATPIIAMQFAPYGT